MSVSSWTAIQYEILKHVAGNGSQVERPSVAYRGRSKLETLFGPGVWDLLAGKTVIDFGCGVGTEVIEMAEHGARYVTGLDIRENLIHMGRTDAEKAGVADRCTFVTEAREPADIILSIDGFEHYDDPATVLRTMRRLLRDDGMVLVSFGPPWFHPYGGHLFSVFPWAHLLLSEQALIRWRSDFKTDGATRFGEVEGGLNQMSVARFKSLLSQSEFEIRDFHAVPIARLRKLAIPPLRELLTSTVRCTLVPN